MEKLRRMRRTTWLMLLLVPTLLIAAALAPAGIAAAPPRSPTLLFEDHFNGGSLDATKWTRGYWWDKKGSTNAGNSELEWYQPNNIAVSNSVLTLSAVKRTIVGSDGNTYPYTSGIVTTGRATWQDPSPDKFAFKYGYAEMRAKVPKGKGLWPAFWLLSCDQGWPPEIDVTEILGDQPTVHNMAVHWQSDGGKSLSNGGKWIGPDFSAGWHTFGVDWQPNAIVWYVDGIERHRYTDSAHIPSGYMYLLINLAVGGTWAGAPSSGTVFPAHFEIDYVRVLSSHP
jgi:beta-glucanase (GH16 family)